MSSSTRTFTVAITLLFLTAALPLAATGEEAPGPVVTDHVVLSFDNTPIATTVMQPAGATATDPVPLVLHSHGWSGSRATEPSGRIALLLEEGYGVVSMDMRGHGESGDVARVHSVDHEIKDVSVVLDWVHDNLDWVLKEPDTGVAKDVRVGGMGGSYGGGWQLLAAALDDRVDVIVPEITWNDLPYALAPNGAIKSTWVHALYGAGKAQARLDPSIDEAYQHAMLTNEIPADIEDQFTASSPKTYAAAIDVPTLLIQGVMDTLFNGNQALWNYEQIAATGAPVKLVTHNEEHGGLPLNKEFGKAQFEGVLHPCGDEDAKALAWYDRHLRGDATVDTGPTVEWAMDDGSCLLADDPADLSTGVVTGAGAPVAVAGSTLVALHGVGDTLAGVPHLSAMIVNTCTPFTVYASLVAVGSQGARVLSAQVTPFRGGPQPGEPCILPTHLPVDLDLGAVGAVVQPDETLALRLDLVNEQYGTNWERAPQAVVLDDVVVTVPVAVPAPG